MPVARNRIPYPLVCIALGAALGWVPLFVHGPIAEKFNPHYIQGAVAVWAFYSARMMIGVWVGLTSWPSAWYLRGPLCGFLSLLPITFIPLAMPECGFT